MVMVDGVVKIAENAPRGSSRDHFTIFVYVYNIATILIKYSKDEAMIQSSGAMLTEKHDSLKVVHISV